MRANNKFTVVSNLRDFRKSLLSKAVFFTFLTLDEIRLFSLSTNDSLSVSPNEIIRT